MDSTSNENIAKNPSDELQPKDLDNPVTGISEGQMLLMIGDSQKATSQLLKEALEREISLEQRNRLLSDNLKKVIQELREADDEIERLKEQVANARSKAAFSIDRAIEIVGGLKSNLIDTDKPERSRRDRKSR
ncbi:hypothetical protein V5O48_003092 [Marasmius crinis-equi]|uniref:Uncharacterized protein n=1 Tax=Marasmius crinis-equi TaxID=585013 RepID=A0ABR3FTT4_9AGAR